MKYAILVGDGMADYPIKELGGKTPLQEADIPNMDFLAKHGKNGTAKTIPDGMTPASDIANMSILGYDPKKYYTGRGPLEAASIGVSLGPRDVAFRCNLITEKDGLLTDYSAGHVSSEEARILIEMLDEALGGSGVKFYPGVSYRHLLVLNGINGSEKAVCYPPHDIVGRPIPDHLPAGSGSGILNKLMNESRSLLQDHEINIRRRELGKNPANMIWLWGQGKAPAFPKISDIFGISGSVISAVDLLKGLGIYAGLKVINVPGATGYLDTNYSGKADYALRSLEENDFVFVHVEAPDEAGHNGDLEAKIQAIEDFDKKVVGGMLDQMPRFGDYKIAVLPDHPTPIPVRTHTSEPVPFALYSSCDGADYVAQFDESSAKEGVFGIIEGHTLIGIMLGNMQER